MASFGNSRLRKRKSRDTSNNLNRGVYQSKSRKLIYSLRRFHTAVEHGVESKVEEILKTGIDIDAPNNDGLTALMIAVYREHQSIIKLLLEYGANTAATRCINTNHYKDFDIKRTVLHYAVEFAKEENIVKLLITVKPNFEITSSEVFDRVVKYAVRRKNSLMLKYLFRDKDVNELDSSILKLILVDNIPAIDLLDWNNKSVLLLAIEKKKVQLVKFLLENGALLDKVCYYDIATNRPLIKCYSMFHVAVSLYTDNQDDELIRLLNNYCGNVNERIMNVALKPHRIHYSDNYGITALDMAVRDNNFALVELLLSLGADINDYCIGFGPCSGTPLHSALQTNFEMFKYLLDPKKISFDNLKSIARAIPYSRFSTESSILVYKLLVSNKYKHPDNDNMAFHMAIVSKNQEIVDSFFNRYSNVHLMEWRGMYPIHRAAESNNFYCLNRLLDLGADIDVKDDYLKRTPLEYAMEKSHVSMVSYIFSKGADVNALSRYCNKILFALVEDHQRKIIEILLDAGINIELFNNYIERYPDKKYALVTVVERFIIKLKAVNIDVNPNALKYKSLKSKAEDENFSSDCINEIDKLKKEMISETSFLSYYHFLTNDVRRLANYTRNQEITSRFNSDYVKSNFPIYGQMITFFYGRALRLSKQIQNVENYLYDVFCNLPIVFIHNVANYLCDHYLKSLYFNIVNN